MTATAGQVLAIWAQVLSVSARARASARIWSKLVSMTTTPEWPVLAADIIEGPEAHRLRLEGERGCAVGLRGVSPQVRRLLGQLDGRHRLPRLILDLPLAEQFQARRLLRDLSAAGLVRAAPPPRPQRREPTVGLVGAGLLARLVAVRLLRQTTARIHLIAPGSPVLGDDPYGRYVDAAVALRARLARGDNRLGRRVLAGGSWTDLGEGSHDLVVVAPPTAQPDRAVTAHLIRHSVPFLPVRVHRGLARLGPLADYRGGACLHCTDLTRADADPDWPRVVERASRIPAQVDPGLAHALAGLTALHVAWFVDDGANPLRGTALELSLDEPGLARRAWPEHPDCACAWYPGLAQDRLPELQAA